MKIEGKKVWLLEGPEGRWIFNSEEKAIKTIKGSSAEPDKLNLQTIIFKEDKIEVKGVGWKEIAVKIMKEG